jgi:hypothetical protein
MDGRGDQTNGTKAKEAKTNHCTCLISRIT